MKIRDVVKAYLERRALTQQGLADALNQDLVNTGVSRASVSYWLNGKYEPETDFLLECAQVYSDWRRQFATECLQTKLPEVFEVQGGRLALKYGMEAVQVVMELADNSKPDVASREEAPE